MYCNDTTRTPGPTERSRTTKPRPSTRPRHCEQLLAWGRAGANGDDVQATTRRKGHDKEAPETSTTSLGP